MEERLVDTADVGVGIKVEDEVRPGEATDVVEDRAGETKAILHIENENKSKYT